MTRLTRIHLVGLLACALAACGSSDGSTPDSALPGTPDAGSVPDAAVVPDAPVVPDVPVVPDTAGVLDTAGGAEAGVQEAGSPAADYCTSKPALASVTDLTGTWAARVIGAIVVNAPIIGVVRQQMVLTLLVDVTQQGTNLLADGKYCNRKQKSESGALTQVVIPDAWAHTETPLQRPGTFTVGGDGIPVVVFTTMAETMGAVLASPATDTLPTSADDPRVIDQDNDGNPGITVTLTGLALSGQIYAVQRQITSFTGIPVSPDRIEGAVAFTTEQNVVGSNPASLATLYAQASQSGADPTVCSSTFTMVKLADAADGGAAVACEWVRANETTLFGQ